VLLPFIKEGMDQGEKSFHIIDGRHRKEHRNRLKAYPINLIRREEKPAKQIQAR
jgi:hypothetical protein